MQLYDMHSHILPAFDDGAKTVEDSLALIACLKKQGISNICLTPHFYTNEISIEDFIFSRQDAFERFRPYIPDDVNIVLGTEVYVTQYLFNAGDLSGITYGKSKYILTEYAYNSTFNDRTMKYKKKIMRNNGLIPVMPHVERYDYLIDNPKVIRELQDMGVIIQTNISNYTAKAPFFKKRKLLKYIANGWIDILGSDAHSFRHNTPEVYSEAMKTIADKCGRDTLERMMKTSEKIFNSALNGN